MGIERGQQVQAVSHEGSPVMVMAISCGHKSPRSCHGTRGVAQMAPHPGQHLTHTPISEGT